ncbi:Acyl-transf-3 domain-containing protein [Aphelenchoides besseyi]|nr:Acyl-transf-3 domain-containing protein [Aphelenchoides besseyi]
MSANGVAVKVQSHSKALARSTAVKRDDIQGLRAFAIVSVFIYHLNAQILPFGFFVISGFLMAMILDAKGKITVRVAVDFYYRRLRRILPTYLLAVLLTLVLAVFCVNPMDRQDVVEDARAAMRLYSNIQPLLRQVTYFQLVSVDQPTTSILGFS